MPLGCSPLHVSHKSRHDANLLHCIQTTKLASHRDRHWRVKHSRQAKCLCKHISSPDARVTGECLLQGTDKIRCRASIGRCTSRWGSQQLLEVSACTLCTLPLAMLHICEALNQGAQTDLFKCLQSLAVNSSTSGNE